MRPGSLSIPVLGFLFAAWAGAIQAQPAGKVLLIGIDGTRPDALANAATPNFDALKAAGAYSDNAITGDISFSGPGWSSMLTGVWCDKHRVISNEFVSPNFAEYPSIMERIEQVDADLRTVSIAHWDKINEAIVGYADLQVTTSTDAEVADLAVMELKREETADFMFLHFDDVDHAGHDCCFGPDDADYRAAIEEVDGLIGRVIDALKARPGFKGENWLVMSSTDHGGGGFIPDQHGANVPQDRTIFVLASQMTPARDDRARLDVDPQIIDIPLTVMDWLGVRAEADWKLDGQVLPLAGRPAGGYQAGKTIPQCGVPREVWDTGKPAFPLPGDRNWEHNPI